MENNRENTSNRNDTHISTSSITDDDARMLQSLFGNGNDSTLDMMAAATASTISNTGSSCATTTNATITNSEDDDPTAASSDFGTRQKLLLPTAIASSSISTPQKAASVEMETTTTADTALSMPHQLQPLHQQLSLKVEDETLLPEMQSKQQLHNDKSNTDVAVIRTPAETSSTNSSSTITANHFHNVTVRLRVATTTASADHNSSNCSNATVTRTELPGDDTTTTTAATSDDQLPSTKVAQIVSAVWLPEQVVHVEQQPNSCPILSPSASYLLPKTALARVVANAICTESTPETTATIAPPPLPTPLVESNNSIEKASALAESAASTQHHQPPQTSATNIVDPRQKQKNGVPNNSVCVVTNERCAEENVNCKNKTVVRNVVGAISNNIFREENYLLPPSPQISSTSALPTSVAAAVTVVPTEFHLVPSPLDKDTFQFATTTPTNNTSNSHQPQSSYNNIQRTSPIATTNADILAAATAADAATTSVAAPVAIATKPQTLKTASSTTSSSASTTAKKTKQMPKIPHALSAYNIFFRIQRQRIYDGIPDTQPHDMSNEQRDRILQEHLDRHAAALALEEEENEIAAQQAAAAAEEKEATTTVTTVNGENIVVTTTTTTGNTQSQKRTNTTQQQRRPRPSKKKQPGKIPFPILSKSIGNSWRNLETITKNFYTMVADLDYKRYRHASIQSNILVTTKKKKTAFVN